MSIYARDFKDENKNPQFLKIPKCHNHHTKQFWEREGLVWRGSRSSSVIVNEISTHYLGSLSLRVQRHIQLLEHIIEGKTQKQVKGTSSGQEQIWGWSTSFKPLSLSSLFPQVPTMTWRQASWTPKVLFSQVTDKGISSNLLATPCEFLV